MNKRSKKIYFPILVEISKFHSLVVGGGEVALRKTLSLLEFGGVVTLLSPRVNRELMELSRQGKIRLIKRPYSRKYLEGQQIVFCATNDRNTNKLVSSDCKAAGIMLNVADDPCLCSFILPANVTRGLLTISVSTQGKAPFFAKEMKRKLAANLSPYSADIMELAARFRSRLLSMDRDNSKAKTKAYRDFLATNWEELLAIGGKKKSNERIEQILKAKV